MRFREKRLLILFFISFILALFVFLAFVSSIVLLISIPSKNNDELNDNKKVFLLTHLDPSSKNQTSFGFARIKRRLSSGEYLSYNNEESGVTSIVSHFHDSEYECTGSCYCLEEKRRRNSASLFNRGFVIIFSAISTAMATNIALESFQNKCENTLSGFCSKMSIKSEVNECEKINIPHEIEVMKAEKDDGTEIRQYTCHGHCVENKRNLYHDTSDYDKFRKKNVKEARKEFGDCSKLQYTGEIEIIIPINGKRSSEAYRVACNVFISRYLKGFCRSQSLVSVSVKKHRKDDSSEYIPSYISNEKVGFYLSEIQTPACIGNTGTYKNIKCKLKKKRTL